MLERRPMLGVFIGLMLCISLWRISTQEPQIITEYSSPYYATQSGSGGVGGGGGMSSSSSSGSSSSLSISNNDSLTYPPPISLDQLPPNDLNKLIDLDNFDFTLNQMACDKMSEHPYTLVLIHSAPKNWNKRNVIRETWGKEDHRARIIFLLGAVNTTGLQHRLEQENNLFADMVQGNFFDAYRNMTYKHVMALKWFSYYCPEAKYLLKTDDDVFVNTPTVYDFLESATVDRRNFLFCSKTENARVSRSYRSKWRVSTKEYPQRFYPTYCPGFSIIYSADTVFSLYKEAQKTPYFWIDDVHITGSLAEATNITITPLGHYYLNQAQRESLFKGYLNATATLFLFTSPNLTEKQIRSLWDLVMIPSKEDNNNYLR